MPQKNTAYKNSGKVGKQQMKKLSVLLAVICVLSAITASVSALPAKVTEFTVYENTPTLDGKIEEGEWDLDGAIALTEDITYAWTGNNASCEIMFYFSWDNEGLWIAADVKDDEVCMPADLKTVYNMDAFQIALDPAGLIGKDGKKGGAMFFSIGPFADGGLGAVYHPYGGSATEFNYKGKSSLTKDGWCFEMCIPWTSIEILAADGFAWKHADGEFINCIICMLDRDSKGSVSHCYKTGLEGKQNFKPADYSHKMILSDDIAPSLKAEEKAPTTAAATMDPIALIAAAAVLSGAVVISKKRK